MIYLAARIFNLFGDVIVGLICIEAIMSWFTPAFGPDLWRAYNLIHSITNPFVEPFRRLLWRFSSSMGIDFSPILAIFAIQFIVRIITRILVFLA